MIRVNPEFDILKELAGLGWTSYELRKQKIFSESSIQRLRKGGLPSWKELDWICKVTMYKPFEIIQFVDDRYS